MIKTPIAESTFNVTFIILSVRFQIRYLLLHLRGPLTGSVKASYNTEFISPKSSSPIKIAVANIAYTIKIIHHITYSNFTRFLSRAMTLGSPRLPVTKYFDARDSSNFETKASLILEHFSLIEFLVGSVISAMLFAISPMSSLLLIVK